MFTVALIGGDGAGKTTIATKLEESTEIPIKRIYMGLNTQSSNFALPTSKIVHYFKKKGYKKEVKASGGTPTDAIPAYYYENKPRKRNFIWMVGRFVNRLAEVLYRQWKTRGYKRKGVVVIYDRYFLFEFTPDVDSTHGNKTNQLFYWILDHLIPKPDMTIFLDAPAEVLYERKKESSLEHLNQRRLAYIEEGKKLKKFIIVDATQSPDQVYREVIQHILAFKSRNNRSLQDTKVPVI